MNNDIKEQVKRDIEVLLKLIELDSDNALEFNEQFKFKHTEELKRVLDYFSDVDNKINVENEEDIEKGICFMKCEKLLSQFRMFQHYIFIPSIFNISSEHVYSFISAGDPEVLDGIVKLPTIRLKNLYDMLLDADEELINETLSLIKSSKPSILGEEIFIAIENRSFDMFKQCIAEYNADISTAGRYLNFMNSVKKLPPLNELQKIVADFDDSDWETLNLSHPFMNELVYICNFEFTNCERDYKELEKKVSWLFSICKKLYGSSFRTSDKIETLLGLCYDGVEFTNISDFEYEKFLISLFVYASNLVKRISKYQNVTIDSFNLENNNSSIEESCCEAPDDYPVCLLNRLRFNKKATIDIITNRYLVNKIKNASVDNIKYVFFGNGIKPNKSLDWLGTKKDLVCFIYYICGGEIVDSEVWTSYLINKITVSGKVAFGKKNDSSSATGRKDEFIKVMQERYFTPQERERYLNDI